MFDQVIVNTGAREAGLRLDFAAAGKASSRGAEGIRASAGAGADGSSVDLAAGKGYSMRAT